ncbi:hypothetical protein DPV78_005500 [Talaromyces pinophilus]|nr:hypothetical protein DPV78_005500 [Talaromyces pinophilus]
MIWSLLLATTHINIETGVVIALAPNGHAEQLTKSKERELRRRSDRTRFGNKSTDTRSSRKAVRPRCLNVSKDMQSSVGRVVYLRRLPGNAPVSYSY